MTLYIFHQGTVKKRENEKGLDYSWFNSNNIFNRAISLRMSNYTGLMILFFLCSFI